MWLKTSRLLLKGGIWARKPALLPPILFSEILIRQEKLQLVFQKLQVRFRYITIISQVPTLLIMLQLTQSHSTLLALD